MPTRGSVAPCSPQVFAPAPSAHIAPRAVMIAPDFAVLRVLETAGIAPPMLEGACARKTAIFVNPISGLVQYAG